MMMRFVIFTTIFAVISVMSAIAYAGPASYDDKAWGNFIEKGIGKYTPSGFPTGNGAISRVHGNEVWPESFATLTSPTDMSRVASIQLSDYAYWDGRYYASESMTAFLVASAQKLQKLTKRADIKIPVYLLAYNANDIPTPHVTDLQEVQLGLFLKDQNGPHPVAEIATDGDSVFPPTESAEDGRLYASYAANAREDLDDLKTFANNILAAKLLNIYNNSSPMTFEELKDDDTEAAYHLRAHEDPIRALIEEKHRIDLKYAKPIQDLADEFKNADHEKRPEIIQKLHQLREEKKYAKQQVYNYLEDEIHVHDQKISHPFDTQILELERENAALPHSESSAERRRIIKDEITRLMNERHQALKDARQAAYDAASRGWQTAESQETKHHKKSGKRPVKPVAVPTPFDAEITDDSAMWPDLEAEYAPKEIDLATTWLMFEAMLTQKAETVMMIKLPGTLRARLITYAMNAKRPHKVIEQFKNVAITTRNEFITLQIACSIRDRFLGCPGKGSDATEAKVNKIAQRILNQAKTASLPEKLQAIQLVTNAEPSKLQNPFDIDELLEEYDRIYFTSEKPLGNVRQNEDNSDAARDDFYDMISKYEEICNIERNDMDYYLYKGSNRYSDGTGTLALPF